MSQLVHHTASSSFPRRSTGRRAVLRRLTSASMALFAAVNASRKSEGMPSVSDGDASPQRDSGVPVETTFLAWNNIEIRKASVRFTGANGVTKIYVRVRYRLLDEELDPATVVVTGTVFGAFNEPVAVATQRLAKRRPKNTASPGFPSQMTFPKGERLFAFVITGNFQAAVTSSIKVDFSKDSAE